MKTCIKCKTEKPKAEFYKHKKMKDGLQSCCKTCDCAAGVTWRKDNPEKAKEIRAAWRKANPERSKEISSAYKAANKEHCKAQWAKWAENNRAKRKAYNAAFYADNIETVRGKIDAWRKANPEKQAEQWRNRRARKRNAEGTHTAADVLSIFTAQRGLCANCQAKLFKSGAKKYHVDHMMPLALGGSNLPDNLQCLCPTCNLSKGAKHPDAWAAQNGRLI